MSDITERLREIRDRDCYDAADEIERLRAELAAEREKTADLGKQIDRLADEVDWVEDEVGAQEKALEEVEAERDALRAELAAEREKSQKWIAKASEDWPEAINEIDRLRAELAKRDEVMKEAQEKLQPISALVDMTPSGFPDHDICPIRLGMARDLRELRARIDAALKGDGDE